MLMVVLLVVGVGVVAVVVAAATASTFIHVKCVPLTNTERKSGVLAVLLFNVSSYCWYYKCTIRALWLCVSGKFLLNMAVSKCAGVTVSTMSFKSTSPLATHSIRMRTDGPQLIGTARSLRESQILLMLIFNITLSQCHMLIQWRRIVLISTGNGSFFIVNDQFVAHALRCWTFCWGNCIDLTLKFRES